VQTPPAEAAGISSAAREAGWALPSRLAALVWSDESEQPVARRLPRGSLAAPLDDGLVCALIPDAYAPGRRAELERALSRRKAAIGPSVPWAETWLSAKRARAAHGHLPDEDGSVVEADERLADLIVHGDAELLDALARRVLAPLDDRTPASRRKLLETLGSWLDHQGNVPRIAEALHVHPQTVRYRLGRLRELFGERLEDPDARFELSMAVRAPR
jgi:hypothetical protein